MTELKKDKRTLKHKLEKNEAFSKNFGESIKYRRRVIADIEARQEREDALREMQEESQRQGWYNESNR
jgi:hypothetical protein